jgi:hypothetical protein
MEDTTPVYLGDSWKPSMTPLITDRHGPIIFAFLNEKGLYCRMELTEAQLIEMTHSALKMLHRRVGLHKVKE